MNSYRFESSYFYEANDKYRTRLTDHLIFLKEGEIMQQTFKEVVKIQGVGLHSGRPVNMIIEPAIENHGICFLRNDLKESRPIRALYSNVVDTRNCTCLGTSSENTISTIEHLMAALYACGIDNALIKVDGPEIPILDGSSRKYMEIFEKIEKVKQSSPRKLLRIKKEVKFIDEKGNSISLMPSDKLHITFDIEFPSKIVGHQQFDEDITKDVFSEKIAPCRTFCEKYQVDYLQSIGLIKGGSLENAVVLDGEKVLNPEGFRDANECVNHKVLDAVGDLYTSGYYMLAKVVANKSGHYHNNEVLKKVFSSDENYEII